MFAVQSEPVMPDDGAEKVKRKCRKLSTTYLDPTFRTYRWELNIY